MAYIDTKDIYKLFKDGVANLHVSDIDALPRAEVEEVRHGEWKPNSYIKGHYICSECGSDIDVGSMCEPRMYYPYCRCGAKMDGGKI